MLVTTPEPGEPAAAEAACGARAADGGGEDPADPGHPRHAQRAQEHERTDEAQEGQGEDDDLPPVAAPEPAPVRREVRPQQQLGDERRPQQPAQHGQDAHDRTLGGYGLAEDDEEEDEAQGPHRLVQAPGDLLVAPLLVSVVPLGRGRGRAGGAARARNDAAGGRPLLTSENAFDQQ